MGIDKRGLSPKVVPPLDVDRPASMVSFERDGSQRTFLFMALERLISQ